MLVVWGNDYAVIPVTHAENVARIAPGAVVGHLGAIGEHRPAVLVDDFEVETLARLLEHDVLGDFGQFRHVLQRLPQRSGGQREFTIDRQAGAVCTAAIVLVRGRVGGGILRRNMIDVLQLRPRRQAVGFDDAGITHLGLHAERVAHRARDDLELVVVHGGEGDEHHEKAHHQAHEIGKGHKPAVPSPVCGAAFFLGHYLSFPDRRHPPLHAGTGSPSSWRCFSGR